MAELPQCDSENRGPVMVQLYYTTSGSTVALQIVEYHNHNPTPITPAQLLEGPEANAALVHPKAMSESGETQRLTLKPLIAI